nr:hypothetical protein [Bacilli bacterium]
SSTGKDIDDRLSEYSDKLIESRNIAASYGVDNVMRDIDTAYMKGNLIAVKTLNIVVQNSNISDENEKKDIINRVEKKVDNINSLVSGITEDFVDDDKNDIIDKSNQNINSDSFEGLESGGTTSLAVQLQNIKKELKRAKVEIASVNMADMMNAIDNSLNNSAISTKSILVPLGESENLIEEGAEDEDVSKDGDVNEAKNEVKNENGSNNSNGDLGDKKDTSKSMDNETEVKENIKKEDDVTIQTIDSNVSNKDNKIENEEVDFKVQSLWNNEIDE